MLDDDSVEVCHVDVHLHWITQRAYLVSIDGDRDRAVWIPRSQCDDLFDEEDIGKNVELEVAEWVAKERGLI